MGCAHFFSSGCATHEYGFGLVGRPIIGLSDGTSHTCGLGDVCLIEDTAGKGHTTTYPNGFTITLQVTPLSSIECTCQFRCHGQGRLQNDLAQSCMRRHKAVGSRPLVKGHDMINRPLACISSNPWRHHDDTSPRDQKHAAYFPFGPQRLSQHWRRHGHADLSGRSAYPVVGPRECA